MKAVGLTRYLPIDNPQSFLDVEVVTPAPAGRDILVRIHAVAVNPVDFKVRRPKDAVEEIPRILGWDAAGIVEAVGENVTLFKPGDEVFYAGDITRPGSNAEYQLVDERIAALKPRSLSFAGAAALPLTAITAWESLFERLALDRSDMAGNAGKTLLIIGAAGGVGSIAIQLAKLAGLTVIATASRPETIRWVRDLGADHVINHRNPLKDELAKAGFADVDYILCAADTDPYFAAMTDIICPQGKICVIVESALPQNIDLLKMKSVTFVYEMMFTRSMFQTPDMIEQHHLLSHIAHLVDQGKITTTLQADYGTLSAETLRKAHAMLESGASIGKIVLHGIGV
ncbi:zinc-binding alcohol dehydrogenase family protein [Thalassospira sp.]|uniref:zinc-binding alcohol dehydrogenase family protein n=1 Tax=Thalassospira sp. TaxID=1912094 RepID=UPI0027334348|nr:zinc-binding alcohol dehydrogenase family protein [Thalassospira sp.]MDP2696514.1 zinc-binding alcohol dehydrogenase family protein [Thalassospira sp.]